MKLLRNMDLLTNAEKQFNDGNFDESIKLINTLVNSQEASYELFLLRGKAFLEKGYLGPSIRDFNLALKLCPENENIKGLLNEATRCKIEFDQRLQTRKEVLGYQILKFLGAGWEGAVYVVNCPQRGKLVLKAYHPHRIEKLNSEIIQFYRKPVAGSKDNLKRLSNISKTINIRTIYPIDLLESAGNIVGALYKYEKLINVTARYLGYSNVRLCLLKAFIDTQGYLLKNLSLVMVDASIGQFMITRTGDFRFVDYGESINPTSDFRCKEEHWEIVTFIKLLYRLFIPEKSHIFRSSDFNVLTHSHDNLKDLVDNFPLLGEIIEKLEKKDLSAFVDFRFYENLSMKLPEKIDLFSMMKILAHSELSYLKNMLLTAKSFKK